MELILIKPFNLQEAIEQGARVVTRCGCKVRLLGYGTGSRPVRAEYMDRGRWVEACYTNDGRYSFNDKQSPYDLMIVDMETIL